MKNTALITGVLIVVVGIGGFFAGIEYQKSKRLSTRDFQAMREQLRSGERPQGLEGRFQGQGRPISGEIIDQDEKSITVKLSDGSSRIVFVGDAVQVNQLTPGTKDELIKGTQVFVIGSENPDGSMTANSIQIGKLGGQ